jgi:hypothetical protein
MIFLSKCFDLKVLAELFPREFKYYISIILVLIFFYTLFKSIKYFKGAYNLKFETLIHPLSIGLLVSVRKKLESNFIYTLYKLFIISISISIILFIGQIILLIFCKENPFIQITPILLGVFATYILAYVFYIFSTILPKVFLIANYEEDLTIVIDNIYEKDKDLTSLLKETIDKDFIPIQVNEKLHNKIHMSYSLLMRDIDFLYSTFTILDDKDSLFKLNQIKYIKTLTFSNKMIVYNESWYTFPYLHNYLEHIKKKYPTYDRPQYNRDFDF